MIYFITNRDDHYVVSNEDLKILNSELGMQKLLNFLEPLSEVGYDKETTSLDPFRAISLLDSIGNSKDQFVIDMTSISLVEYQYILHDKLVIGHNLAYDYSVNLAKNKYHNQSVIHIGKLYDTMLVEQRLGLGSKRKNDLFTTHQRRLNYDMKISKEVRNQFVNNNDIKFTQEQVEYSAYDTECLPKIKDVQMKYVEHYKMELLINIEFNALKSIVGAMIEGFQLDEQKWLERIKQDEEEKLSIALELDQELRNLGYGQPTRYNSTVEQLGMFNNNYTVSNKNIKNVNYGSTNQVCAAIQSLGLPVPEIEERGDYGTVYKQSIKEEVLESYRYENPDTPLKNFIDLLLQWKEKSKAINSFGYKFLYENVYDPSTKKSKLGYKRELTGKVHTVYRQCVTMNGRFASGDTLKGLYNSQQIPKEKKYRNCFISGDSNYKITTLDYSGAELIILGALAKDKNLIKLQSEDIHSHLATKSYTSIIKFILKTYKDKETRISELIDLLKPNKVYRSLGELSVGDKERLIKERIQYALETESFLVNKEHSKDIRDPFKNVVYGTSYGASKSKIAKTLHVKEKYGELVLKSMEQELPATFKFLEQSSKSGVKNGYIVFNDRTNSRHWFKEALEAQEYGYDLTSSQIGDIERACKNYRISGTQADMIKEAIGNVDKYITENGLDAVLLLQVHDEIVVKHHKDLVDLPQTIADIMTDTANLYLNGMIKMSVEYETLDYWTK